MSNNIVEINTVLFICLYLSIKDFCSDSDVIVIQGYNNIRLGYF